jgi:3D-(3,5/4)-trihydroxycyclohexane-1,2-dione acylhydrolase (decyclizing)
MTKTIKLTVAQALIKFLNNQYIEFDGKENKMFAGVFAIFGHGNILGIGQALEENPGTLITRMGRNEQGMAHAAIGFTKQKRRKQMYACTSSIGPGATNMLTAAATATANCIPVLLLPGDTYADRQPDPVLQQIEKPDNFSVTANDAFKPLCKYWDKVTRPEMLMTACLNAMRVLADPGETGAVCLAMPQDVQGEAYDYPECFFSKRVHYIERTVPTARAITAAAQLMINKKRPFMVLGGGVKYSEAEEVFSKFAEKYNIPFGETQAGKGIIPWDHSHNLGGVGVTGSLGANELASQADLIIGVGTRYTDFTTASKWLFQNPQVDFLNINISQFHAQKMDGTQVVGDAKAALAALDRELAKTNWRAQYENEISQAKRKNDLETERVYGIRYTGSDFVPEVRDEFLFSKVSAEFIKLTNSVMTQTEVLGVLNATIGKDAIVVAASGSIPGDLQRIWRTGSLGGYHVEYGFSCMGYEVNAALGVKLAEPHREVYAFVGDGAYMMSHSELPQSIAEHQKINVIVFDNMTNGCINNLEIGHGQGSFGTEFRFRNKDKKQLDGGFVPIDFAMNAASYGCKSYTVRNAAELYAAILDAKRQKVSTLIHVKVLPKTMTHGYDVWWRVGMAQVTKNERITKLRVNIQVPHLDDARKY